MSLKTLGSNTKEAAKELTSVAGLKKMAMWLGIGFALGVISDLILEALHWNVLVPYAGADKWYVSGVAIYPNRNTLPWDDILLIVVTVVLLFTKKLWMVVGFFLGWYFTGYMGLYDALHLPKPVPPAA